MDAKLTCDVCGKSKKRLRFALKSGTGKTCRMCIKHTCPLCGKEVAEGDYRHALGMCKYCSFEAGAYVQKPVTVYVSCQCCGVEKVEALIQKGDKPPRKTCEKCHRMGKPAERIGKGAWVMRGEAQGINSPLAWVDIHEYFTGAI